MTAPTPPPPPPLTIEQAAAAAVVEHQAQQAAEAEAQRTRTLAAARTALAKVLGPRVDVSVLSAQIVDGGSVVVTQGNVSLSVDPAGRVFLVRFFDGRWVHPGRPVRSLLDIARALEAQVADELRDQNINT